MAAGIPSLLRLDAARLTASSEVLGHGAFATVYSAKYNFGRAVGSRAVAFKKLEASVLAAGRPALEALVAELTVQAAVAAHPNVTAMFGAVCDPAQRLVGLVLELAPHGSLHDLLHLRRDTSVAWAARLSLAVDVAAGLEALHGHLPRPIVHNDLKSGNVLLFDAGGGGQMVAKLSDFGLAGFTKHTSSLASARPGIGTANWKAPDVYEETYVPSTAADVWSLGLVVFEFLCRLVPYAGRSDAQVMKKVLSANPLPDLALAEAGAPAGLAEVVRACCDPEPSERPLAGAVAARLRGLRDGLQGGGLQEGGLQGVAGRDLGAVVEAVERLREELKAQVPGTGLLSSRFVGLPHHPRTSPPPKLDPAPLPPCPPTPPTARRRPMCT
jgi:serine/threonine protein kinase